MGQKQRVYKFRSINKRAIDIIEKNQLHCANFNDLNDPMDGWFVHLKDNPVVETIKSGKQNYGICSLSTTYKNPLLWTHYADGFKGIAIEIEVDKINENGEDDKINEDRVYKIAYERELPDLDELEDKYKCYDEIAKRILITKRTEFCYESEARILHKGDYYSLEENGMKIKKILFFDRKVKKNDPGCLKELTELLRYKNIKFNSIRISLDFKISIDTNYARLPS
jgi:hypothetical protein